MFGEIIIRTFYSDNVPYCQEVSFCIPSEKWNEFENLPAYQEIKAYVESQQIQDTPFAHCEAVCGAGTEAYKRSSNHRVGCESFWDRARRLRRRKQNE